MNKNIMTCLISLMASAALLSCGSNSASKSGLSQGDSLLNPSANDLNKAGKPFGPTTISMAAKNWDILYSIGMPRTPTALSGTSWFFDFPDISKGEIDYLTQKVTGSIKASSISINMEITTTGTPEFDYKTEPGNTCVSPANARFYIQRAWNNDNYVRWWSNPVAIPLVAGPNSVRVNLTPSEWTDTWGSRGDKDAESVAGFNKTLESPQQIGMTFGGGCFFGHGVRVVGGTAKFIVTKFALE